MAIYQYQINLCVRHPERFNQILNRGVVVKLALDRLFSIIGPDEVVELFIKSD